MATIKSVSARLGTTSNDYAEPDYNEDDYDVDGLVLNAVSATLTGPTINSVSAELT